MKIRAVTGTALVVVLLAALAGCATSEDAPAARPQGVTTTPTSADEPEPLCVVRSSLASNTVRPSKIVSQGKLVAGVDPSDATMSHWDANTKQFEGFNIDLLVEVARAIWPGERNPRDRITFRVVRPGQNSFDLLYSEDPMFRVDIIATSLTATCERAGTVRFSNNYLDSGQTALVRRKDGNPEFAGMEALGGRRVCAAAGTTSLAEIAGYRTEDGSRPVPVQAPHSIDCLVMLRQGQVDAVSTDENILIGFAEMAPDTMLVTEPPKDNEESCEYHKKDKTCTWFTDEPHAFAFRKADEDIELTRFVNHVLESPRVAEVWEDARKKWLRDHPDQGKPEPGPVATP